MVRCLCGLLLVIGVAFSDCPSGCCCPRPGGGLVLCEALGLRSVPRSVPLGTAVLSMARNRLCDVDHLLQPFSGLQELSLSHNQLARFPKGLPPSLEALQLQENRLTYLTAGALRRLGNLTRLDLEDNRIRVIQPGAFQGLAKLRVLSLRGNRLRSLPPSLPPSLAHLDLSANCIAALDPPSLAGLVDLQVLKVGGNCLRSVPERAFDGMRRLRAVELEDNLWACECHLLYLYRWLLDGRLRLAARLVCSAPRHLARRPLLTLPVTAICPHVLRPNATVATVAPDTGGASATVPNAEAKVLLPNVRASPAMSRDSSPSPATPAGVDPDRESVPGEDGAFHARLLQTRYALEELSYEDCLSLNSTLAPVAPPPTQGPQEGPGCSDDPGSPRPPESYTTPEISSPVLPTNKAGVLPATAPPGPTGPWGPTGVWGPTPVTALLALLCVLVALLLIAVLVLLKKLLHRNQRVAPLQLS